MVDVDTGLGAEWHTALGTEHPTRNAHAYALLHAICATAVQDEVFDANPCRIRAAMQTKRRRDVDILTPAQVDKLASKMPTRCGPASSWPRGAGCDGVRHRSCAARTSATIAACSASAAQSLTAWQVLRRRAQDRGRHPRRSDPAAHPASHQGALEESCRQARGLPAIHQRRRQPTTRRPIPILVGTSPQGHRQATPSRT